jgi:hypothetical protein
MILKRHQSITHAGLESNGRDLIHRSGIPPTNRGHWLKDERTRRVFHHKPHPRWQTQPIPRRRGGSLEYRMPLLRVYNPIPASLHQAGDKAKLEEESYHELWRKDVRPRCSATQKQESGGGDQLRDFPDPSSARQSSGKVHHNQTKFLRQLHSPNFTLTWIFPNPSSAERHTTTRVKNYGRTMVL